VAGGAEGERPVAVEEDDRAGAAVRQADQVDELPLALAAARGADDEARRLRATGALKEAVTAQIPEATEQLPVHAARIGDSGSEHSYV
jgi:hypothetical protein